ncbi:MAG TPA: acetyl-CoA carboxylase biotin carboxyl carrier protein subunit [Kiloniellales bacterium]
MAKLECDEALIRRLSELLEETGLSEIEYEAEGQRIRVARHSQVLAAPVVAAPLGTVCRPETVEVPVDGEAVPANAVAAPMVGTVYVAAEPGGAPFVSVNDEVEQGQTLVIIEAMKVMNPIPSPRAGTVKRILIRDGQPVEFGEPLMVIE